MSFFVRPRRQGPLCPDTAIRLWLKWIYQHTIHTENARLATGNRSSEPSGFELVTLLKFLIIYKGFINVQLMYFVFSSHLSRCLQA